MSQGVVGRNEQVEIDSAVAGLTFADAFAATVARRGESRAMRWRNGDHWAELTWNELEDSVRNLAHGLATLGFHRGDRVVLFTGCRPEHLVADLAAISLGGVAVSMYDTFDEAQLQEVMSAVRPTVIVVDNLDRSDRIHSALQEIDQPANVIALAEAMPDAIPWSSLVDQGRSRRREIGDKPIVEAQPEDPMAIAYTSGTTGDLKAVVHTHRGVLWHAESFQRRIRIDHEDSTVAYLPFAHATSRFVAYYLPLLAGAEIHFCAELERLRDHLLDARPTFLVGVLQVWENLYRAVLDAADGLGFGQVVRDAVDVRRQALRAEHSDDESPTELSSDALEEAAGVCFTVREQLGLDRCRLGASGAGHLALEVVEFFNALGLSLAEGWGQSELISAATIAAPDRIAIGTAGPPLPGVEVRIANDAELLVRSGSSMLRYLHNRERTSSTIDADGWLRTGDYGEIVQSGDVRVFGRDGEFMTASDGTVVSFGRVESLLKTHPSVINACVAGGEPGALRVLLNVDREAGGVAPSNEMKAHIEWANERLSGEERIESFVTVSPAWIPGESRELTHTGKLRRSYIADAHRAAIACLGSPGSL